MSREILLVTGVSASGKDYLLNRAKDHEPRLGAEVPIVSMGSTILLKLAQLGGESLDRDKMKHAVSNDVMRGVVCEIVSDLVAAYPAAVLNGHITYRQQGELVSNPDVDAEINPVAYAVVVADPSDIAEWRASSDANRRREQETVDEIAYHQDFTIQTAERMAVLLGARCQIIENNLGNTDASSLILATMVTDICPK
ncbi:MAG TPA: AAA family ATPase [Candidatus Saccharimonadales bacterium]|nr:AAA family ATPase [Candidatus Saccharimonadales bacterium]